MVFAVTLGLISLWWWIGIVAETFSPFLGFFGAFITAPLIAWATDGPFTSTEAAGALVEAVNPGNA